MPTSLALAEALVRQPNSFLLSIDPMRCTGCGWCVAACPLHLLSLEAKGWRKHSVIHDPDTCTGCKKCEVRCLFNAIQVARLLPPKQPSTDAASDPQQAAPAVLS